MREPIVFSPVQILMADIKTEPRTNKAPSHHTREGFRNPHVTGRIAGFGDLLKWQFGEKRPEPTPVPDDQIPPYVPQIVAPDLDRIHHPDPAKLQITWIGHASFLLQLQGMNILTDPVFSERCSPVSFAGPIRQAPPGLSLKELPRIDLVLQSHDHYDHLDIATVRFLGDKPSYIAPLGLKAWYAAKGIHKVTELDWWQSSAFQDLKIHATPAQHFSGRSFVGRNKSLWCGYMLESDGRFIHFVGDTGYSPDFKEIGRRFSPIDLAFIPIGAYRPRWFMGSVHCDPQQAVQIHQDLGAARSIGMHWGTFRLSDEPMAAPPIELALAARKALQRSDEFTVMGFGETRSY